MQIVIDIPEKLYNRMKTYQGLDDTYVAVKYGTPLPKGHWKHGKELCKEYHGRILVDVTYADWHCSNCNYVIKGTVKPKWNYCPNCGAKMLDPQESEG